MNPLAETPATESDDLRDVRLAQGGSRDALEALVGRHQRWIYNLVLRMVYLPQDAEDATQEILIKLVTKLSTFHGASSFRTWLYRIACNHVLNMRRGRAEERRWTFVEYGAALDGTEDRDLPDTTTIPADVRLLVEEAKIGCTSGMLLCLDREQRLVYVLGAIFGVTDVVGADVMGMGRDAFRQKLSRARRDLHRFMQDQCGLINAANPCRCARKTRGFMAAGFVDPANLLFARPHVERIRDVSPAVMAQLDELDAAYGAIHRDHPFQPSPDFVRSLRVLVQRPEFRTIVAADDKELHDDE
jgi:RNA polymerase sigma factor (sigma-70 family)